MSWMNNFKRAVGLKASFRRTGASTWPNIALGAFVGVVSGRYIFKQPLEEYWAEQRDLEAERSAGGSATNGAAAASTKAQS
mmetsp:Transcript_2178/g.5788  ORF Transcript_2178/g.5788 Transcript_2178/m.5788 type:complete len:81 (+) Transcript_2178:50-292(+)